MTKQEFSEWVKEGIRVLDGATGTELQKMGMPLGVCPEQWVCENPDALLKIQRDYIESGSDILYTCTLGGNPLKLKEFGIDNAVQINREVAAISKKAAAGKALVAGDIAPTGQLMQPFGDYTFEEIVNVYKQQVQGLLEGGVDLFAIETMMDIQEARAALLAVKESCDLPAIVTMTFEKGGHTINGTDPLTALVTLQSLGADAVGCNCSTGPKEMLEIIRQMKPYARVPLAAKPNAGLPRLINGKTIFNMNADEFTSYVESFIEAGANLLGGCCGTSPEFIQKIAAVAKGRKCREVEELFSPLMLSSFRKTVFIGKELPLCVIGERINPTGKKKLREELLAGSMDLVTEYAMAQVDEGASVLDVNAGVPGIDEAKTLTEIVSTISTLVQAPLCLDSSSPDALESALRVYPGRALINSVSCEAVKLQKILPIAAKYGAAFILLPVEDSGVPEKAEERIAIIQRVFEQARQYGYTRSDILVDGLVMTIASNQAASMETIKVIRWSSEVFGANTTVGLSNVSFGLPERSWINAAFLAMAAAGGLSAAIMNPGAETLMHVQRACDALTGRDHNSLGYIQAYSSNTNAKDGKKQEDPLYNALLDGFVGETTKTVKAALESGLTPGKILDEHLIPAITKVGELYEKKVYFLPQLIQSAEAMKAAMELINPLLQQAGCEVSKGRVVLATVKGDIHDIGKNIVGLMLRNYGFEVFDLGKDVPAEAILEKAQQVQAQIIGLSALMTTTMTEMRRVVQLARQLRSDVKIIIGGAAVDESYANEIGADAYAADAYAAVKKAEALIESF
ncbi:MAG: homocysteine S-methyltransferase family protein [Thermoclostridium sp.]|nr:homocysteine S-methyltransferase family protein [Thermoclostridium sp.]